MDLTSSRSGDWISDCLKGMLSGDFFKGAAVVVGVVILVVVGGILLVSSKGNRCDTSGGFTLEVVFFLNVNFLPSMAEREKVVGSIF